ncbi:MAG: TetR family transcriptional regulator [Actinomycetota bacterium]
MAEAKGTNARGRATKSHLEITALRLFLREGYEETTVERIAEAADVSVRTFFHHFPNKLDVLWGDAVEEMEAFAQQLRARPEPDVSSALAAAIVEYADGYEYGEADLLRFRIIHESDLYAEQTALYDGQFRQMLGRWLSERTGRDPDDFRLAAAAAVFEALRQLVVSTWAASGGEADVGELASIALATVRLDLD